MLPLLKYWGCRPISCECFIPEFLSILPSLCEYNDDLELTKPEAARFERRILVAHDISTINVNDGGGIYAPLEACRNRFALGRGLMVSDVLTAAQGHVTMVLKTRSSICINNRS